MPLHARLAGLHLVRPGAAGAPLPEAIPLQTTAMNEVTTILGGMDNIEQALLNIHERAKPALIGICLDRPDRDQGRRRRRLSQADPRRSIPELGRHRARLCLDAGLRRRVPGRLGQGGDARSSRQLAEPRADAIAGQVNVLPGSHLTPGDIEELREIVEAFGLQPIIAARSLRLARRPYPGRLHADHAGRHDAGGDRATSARPRTRWRSASRCARPRRRCRTSAACRISVFDRLTGLDGQRRA